MWASFLALLLAAASGLKLSEVPECKGAEAAADKQCTDLPVADCASFYTKSEKDLVQCAVSAGNQCLSMGPVCAKPKVPALPAAGLEFYFGSSLKSGLPATSILDEGKTYAAKKTPSGFEYGWLCNGQPIAGYDFAGGRRGPPRSTYGLNHFDRSNRCKSGSTYLPVTWKLNIPDGKYNVEVIFPEAYTKACQVQGVKVCGARGTCSYSKQLEVTGGLQVTGYGHDSGMCHSLSKVKVTNA
mmetsp:Transcript_7945/g.14451  ORF Transcript_7945/g.14451 Transcript_7945/m.14451 type:complete len:241 (+) Transcript_7945:71-793(+)